MHKARRYFSQNFLINKSFINAVISASSPTEKDFFIEIGPGLGALTDLLLKTLKHLIAIEIDNNLVDNLEKRYSKNYLTILRSNVLNVDFSRFERKMRLIGSLPYHISSPILFHLSNTINNTLDQHFILQRDYVDRMVAKPSTSVYGRLSVVLQAKYKMEKVFEIPPEAFNPKPKVFSALVRMVPINDPLNFLSFSVFENIVAQAFSNRRKMLRKTLGKYAIHIPWERLKIKPTDRAQDVSVEKFIALSNILLMKGLIK